MLARSTKLSAAALALALLVLVPSELSANILIRFAPGKTETTIKARIPTAKKICYFANGKAGQTLKASVTSASGFVSIFESGTTEYEYVLDVPGKTSVCVDNLGRTTSFSLDVSIK